MAFVLYAPNIKSGINGGIGIKSHGQRVNGPIRESDLGRPRDKRGA